MEIFIAIILFIFFIIIISTISENNEEKRKAEEAERAKELQRKAEKAREQKAVEDFEKLKPEIDSFYAATSELKKQIINQKQFEATYQPLITGLRNLEDNLPDDYKDKCSAVICDFTDFKANIYKFNQEYIKANDFDKVIDSGTHHGVIWTFTENNLYKSKKLHISSGTTTKLIEERMIYKKITDPEINALCGYNLDVHDWYEYKDLIETIVIDGDFTTIGKNQKPYSMFVNYSSLQMVIINAHVKEIGREVFKSCECLKYVDLPDGLISIGEKSFGDCPRLENVKLPETVESIGVDAFKSYRSFTLRKDAFGLSFCKAHYLRYEFERDSFQCKFYTDGSLKIEGSGTLMLGQPFGIANRTFALVIP